MFNDLEKRFDTADSFLNDGTESDLTDMLVILNECILSNFEFNKTTML